MLLLLDCPLGRDRTEGHYRDGLKVSKYPCFWEMRSILNPLKCSPLTGQEWYLDHGNEAIDGNKHIDRKAQFRKTENCPKIYIKKLKHLKKKKITGKNNKQKAVASHSQSQCFDKQLGSQGFPRTSHVKTEKETNHGLRPLKKGMGIPTQV